jgi:AraC-like DNA-binding protein
LLDNLAVRVEPFALARIPSGSSLRVAPEVGALLHFVLEGDGDLVWGRARSRVLRRGSLVVMPGCLGHVIRCRPSTGDRALRAVPGTGEIGGITLYAGQEPPQGEEEVLALACGRVRASYAHGPGLFDLLTDPLVVEFTGEDEVAHIFERILKESQHPVPGSGALLAALMNQCLVLLFRQLCENDVCRLPWLEALKEPRMARVLQAMLEEPEGDHSLDSLAARVSMSRSAFAHEFKKFFGRTPMAFLREVRLRRATELLHNTALPIDTIGRRVGFASRSHFSHAFRDHFGTCPADFRRSHAV